MENLKKYKDLEGLQNIVKENDCGLGKVKFDILRLKINDEYKNNTFTNEVAFVLLSGEFSIKGKCFNFENIKRRNVFHDKPMAVYLPFDTEYEVVSLSDELEIAICSASSNLKSKPVLIKNEDVKEYNLGVLNWKRKAYFIIDERLNSENFYIGETFLSPGKWAFPPHRHDFDNYPEEVKMDEIYHYRINPSNGFGIQILYSDDKSVDNSFTVRNGDTMILAEGYHPASASPTDALYILWFMAGKNRYFLSKADEQYKWVKNCEALI